MAEIVAPISEVQTKTLPTGVVIYIVKAAGKEYSTRDRSLAQIGYRAVGSDVLLDYDEKKNDKGFTNRYLNHIAPVDGGGPAEAGLPPSGLFDDSEPEVARASGIDKDEQIARAVALKAAVDTLPQLPAEQRTAASVLQIADFYMPFLTGAV